MVLHWRMTATHTGDAFGFPASGNRVDIDGQDIMRIVDGKITEIYHVEELLKLTQQISGGAQSAIRWTKQALNNWYRSQSAILDASLAYEFIGFAGPDAREGLASHTEKRAPRFDGPTGE